MREIELTQGKVSIVDDEDYEAVMKYKWCAHKDHNTWYAIRRLYNGGRMSIHTFVTGYKKTDHINGNGLDNRRENLREVTDLENSKNSRLRSDSTTGYKGVWQVDFRFRACIRINKKRIHIGYFTDPKEAALAYDEAARKYHGEYARLNFPGEGEQPARS